ncbi:MAG: sugar phosphate isomerase/epimerase family protein [Agriterribacter sp.]
MKEVKISCADFTFPLLQHEKVFDLIALLDVKGIDIGLFSGRSHITAETEFDNLSHNAKVLKQKLNDRGLTLSDIYLQLHTNLAAFAINHPDESKRKYARERFLRFIDYAKEAGTDHITTLPGMHFKEEDVDRSVHRSYEELNWRVEKTKAAGLQFSVEVHTGSPFMKPEDALTLLRSVPGLGLTLDYTHFIRDGYVQQDVDVLLPYAHHFHSRGAKQGRLQTSMSENIIDYPDIIQKLKKLHYSGWIGLEYIWIEWEKCNEADTLSESLRLKKIIEEAYVS